MPVDAANPVGDGTSSDWMPSGSTRGAAADVGMLFWSAGGADGTDGTR